MFLQLKLYIFRFMKKSEWHQIWENVKKLNACPHTTAGQNRTGSGDIQHFTYFISNIWTYTVIYVAIVARVFLFVWRQVATTKGGEESWEVAGRAGGAVSAGQWYWQSSWGLHHYIPGGRPAELHSRYHQPHLEI